MSIDSLKKRYLFKLISSLIGFGISIGMQSMVSRGLGPKSFGNYSFLTGLFTQLVLFFDLGNSSGFFVKLSQRPKEFGLISFYFYFTAIGMILFMSVFIVFIQFSGIYQIVFPGQEIIIILISAVWAILGRYLQILNSVTDAYGLTVKSEKGLIFQKIIGIILIAILFFTHKLDLTNYFLVQYFLIIMTAGIFAWVVRENGFFNIENWQIKYLEFRRYLKEFYEYSHPIFFGFVFGLLSVSVDRWLLQYYSGSIQQGFYGLSYQLATISTLFTGAMTMLIIREFSIAFSKHDFNQMAVIFRRFIPLLYSLTAYLSCFTVIQAKNIIQIIGGQQYKDAYLTVAIMSLYPIHQTYGQLSGSVLLASGQTRLYSIITILSSVFGLPILFFFLGPKNLNALNMGAVGLAAKMVLIQFVFVNIQLFYNSKFLKLNFWKYFAHQLVSLILLLSLSLAVYMIVENIYIFRGNILIKFLISGLIYTIFVFASVIYKPKIFGLVQEDISYLKSSLVQQKIKIQVAQLFKKRSSS